MEAASALGKTQQGKEEAIQVLIELIHKSIEVIQDVRLSKEAISSLNQIAPHILAPSSGWSNRIFSDEDDLEFVAAKFSFIYFRLREQDYIDFDDSLHEFMWHFAQVTTYPIFYKAWHQQWAMENR